MGRKRKVSKEDIESGYLTCKSCNQKREIIMFYKKRYNYNGLNEVSYDLKCKICQSKNSSYKVKNVEVLDMSRFILSREAKLFIEKIIKMRGYIDIIDAYRLAHYHIETFDYIDRMFDSTEDELLMMYKELLNIYKKEKTKNNI